MGFFYLATSWFLSRRHDLLHLNCGYGKFWRLSDERSLKICTSSRLGKTLTAEPTLGTLDIQDKCHHRPWKS